MVGVVQIGLLWLLGDQCLQLCLLGCIGWLLLCLADVLLDDCYFVLDAVQLLVQLCVLIYIQLLFLMRILLYLLPQQFSVHLYSMLAAAICAVL